MKDEESTPSDAFWATVNVDDVLDHKTGKVDRLRVHNKCSKGSQQVMPCWQAGFYDKEVWEVSSPEVQTGTSPCVLLHKSTGASYEVPRTRVNKALLALDPEIAAMSLVPSATTCRCVFTCAFTWLVCVGLALKVCAPVQMQARMLEQVDGQ